MLYLVVPNNIWGLPAVSHQGFRRENLASRSALPPGGEFWQAGPASPVQCQTGESKDTSVVVSFLSSSYAVWATMKAHKKNKESTLSPDNCFLAFRPSPGEYLSFLLLPIILIHPLFSTTFTKHLLCSYTIKSAGVTEVKKTNKPFPHGFSYSQIPAVMPGPSSTHAVTHSCQLYLHLIALLSCCMGRTYDAFLLWAI